MAIITPISELEAVNLMLKAIGESPTSTLSGDVGLDVVTAHGTLNDVMREVQSEGWQFNTEYDFPLPRTVDGAVSIPANALSLDVDRRAYHGLDPVQRGTRLYDRKNHTYTFDVDVKAKIIFGFGFAEMPQSARHYVAVKAARRFQDDSVGSNDLHRFKSKDEEEARLRLLEDQAEEEDLNFLRDDPHFQTIMRL